MCVTNELITNAAKYAYPGNPGGHVRVRLARGDGGAIHLSIRDEGEGLPADFDLRSAAGIGMRIVRAFSQQLNAHRIRSVSARDQML